MINRFFSVIFAVLCSLPVLTFAHDSSHATLQLIRVSGEQWVFEVKTPLYGLDLALREQYKSAEGEPLESVAGSKEYKELLVEYIKSGFDLTAIGRKTTDAPDTTLSVHPSLGKGKMKIDNHETVLLFQVNGMPDEVDGLEFHFDYMAENEAQHNLVRLIDQDRSQRYILNARNAFQAVDAGFFKVD